MDEILLPKLAYALSLLPSTRCDTFPFRFHKAHEYFLSAGRIEDYGKLSAGIGAFTAGAISLSTAVKQHDYDAKKFEKQKKEAKEGKKR